MSYLETKSWAQPRSRMFIDSKYRYLFCDKTIFESKMLCVLPQNYICPLAQPRMSTEGKYLL